MVPAFWCVGHGVVWRCVGSTQGWRVLLRHTVVPRLRSQENHVAVGAVAGRRAAVRRAVEGDQQPRVAVGHERRPRDVGGVRRGQGAGLAQVEVEAPGSACAALVAREHPPLVVEVQQRGALGLREVGRGAAQGRARRATGRPRARGGSGRTSVALTKPTSQPSSVRTRCGSQTPTDRSPSIGSGSGRCRAGGRRSAGRRSSRASVTPTTGRAAPVEVAPGAGRDQPPVRRRGARGSRGRRTRRAGRAAGRRGPRGG